VLALLDLPKDDETMHRRWYGAEEGLQMQLDASLDMIK
jgi:hypothetical protein